MENSFLAIFDEILHVGPTNSTFHELTRTFLITICTYLSSNAQICSKRCVTDLH